MIPLASGRSTPANENAELLSLGEKIEPALVAWHGCLARRLECRAAADRVWPVVPEELILTKEDRTTFSGVWSIAYIDEVDAEGARVYVNGPNLPGRRIFYADGLRQTLDYWKWSPRNPIGRRVRKLIKIAEKYEADCDAAIEASGIVEAAEAQYNARTEIDRVAFEIRDIPPVTMQGLLIHARSHAAIDEVFKAATDASIDRPCFQHCPELANALLRVGGMPS
jgi:hypothetical protein